MLIAVLQYYSILDLLFKINGENKLKKFAVFQYILIYGYHILDKYLIAIKST